MRNRLPAVAVLAMTVAACAGGGPATLGYGLPSQNEVRYSYADTTIVEASVMGQSMEIAVRSTADYAASFSESSDGVEVSLTVADLQGSVSQPMGGPVNIDEDGVLGAIVFSLDRMGNATVVSLPEVTGEASQMVSTLGTAHSFFPGLPDRVVAVGDQWAHNVTFDGDDTTGPVIGTATVNYTYEGDRTVGGRTVMNITFEGTSEISNSMDMQGMQIAQASSIEVEGYVLWDAAAGVPVEMFRSGSGEGTVSVPIAPTPFPIQVETTQWARIEGM